MLPIRFIVYFNRFRYRLFSVFLFFCWLLLLLLFYILHSSFCIRTYNASVEDRNFMVFFLAYIFGLVRIRSDIQFISLWIRTTISSRFHSIFICKWIVCGHHVTHPSIAMSIVQNRNNQKWHGPYVVTFHYRTGQFINGMNPSTSLHWRIWHMVVYGIFRFLDGTAESSASFLNHKHNQSIIMQDSRIWAFAINNI